ncbi:hypothetical protein GKZ68_02860 [Hymenobacter sp. BRD128]|uniref:phasin family protein n=1 Tax=Hymenobacter sp. BRD128 TaxID=2675878 RepID=UPI0015659022|nr:hypothetical protein [Hymenobacter sp. BRD128]QKG55670.1 hypothetical protein GKZ68_02860 [Hymenobacter sp. BRD128]
MDDLFKKFINTGVGFLSQGNKAVQTAIEKLVKESKISEQEGKKIMDDLLKSGEAKRADLEKQFKGLTEDLKSRVGLKDEKAAPAKAKPAAKPAAKKPATSTTAQAAGTVKKAADKVSAAAARAQHSAAAKAGAPKKAAVQSADDSGQALDTK